MFSILINFCSFRWFTSK